MLAALPAQFGVPGGPELVIVALVLLLLTAPVALGVVALVLLLRRRSALEERIAALESDVDRLRERVENGR
ncbi:preprotein translocase subunit TatA [Halorubrum sp. 48-1-W]|uniref:preprotein translocase subunit TatA n=1 Tax=Halorubrum sp. 48-1-W TaxID=2249761 RepID=UPI000DCC74D8|nr:preprotein translocase subunit TatA [Halorubrum sp. 48-1-W]RAW44207.1 preprotein translocase subunit TatA [Halorubrum sp. 48-1-W]